MNQCKSSAESFSAELSNAAPWQQIQEEQHPVSLHDSCAGRDDEINETLDGFARAEQELGARKLVQIVKVIIAYDNIRTCPALHLTCI